ncbi:MAG: hypothetical protein COA38_17050 [Fluviicola sp.]|nr:MAG: hypothetical protein COA38_17050 [Fluviicola sp.]
MSKQNKLEEVEKYVIYPAVGISRVGNSEEWYYSPELPGQVADPRVPLNLTGSLDDIKYKEDLGEKSTNGSIKKQAARFRVYGLDRNGKVVAEINPDLNDDDIKVEVQWKVHLANRKGAWYDFINPMDLNLNSQELGNTKELALAVTQRNNSFGGVPYGLQPGRDKLVIDAGEVSIQGINESSDKLTGEFVGAPVTLGELRTDEKGRLIVIGGSGSAKSVIPNNPVHHFANNSGWYDDTSDGTVRANVIVTKKGEEPLTCEAESAFVAVVPPNYGQGLYGTITMYDIVKDVYSQRSTGGIEKKETPDFADDIWPIFKSISDTQWVSNGLYMLFGIGSASNFASPEVFAKLISKKPEDQDFKLKVLSWFRNPLTKDFDPTQLPPNYGDALRDFSDQPNENLWITRTQYSYLKEWAKGNFISTDTKTSDTHFPLKASAESDPLIHSDLEMQPYLLTKAALQECLGGPFRPGIEVTWPFRVDQMWKPAVKGEISPFRLQVVVDEDDKIKELIKDDYGPVLSPEKALAENGPVHYSGPGTLTRWMGVPWQADAASCLGGLDASNYLPVPALWAPRAPQEVISEQSLERMKDGKTSLFQKVKYFNNRQFWLRDLDNSNVIRRLNEMTLEWSDLGIVSAIPVTSKGSNDEVPEIIWVEQQRAKAFSNWDPTYLQLLVAEGEITPEEAVIREKAEREEYQESMENPEKRVKPRKILGRLEH